MWDPCPPEGRTPSGPSTTRVNSARPSIDDHPCAATLSVVRHLGIEPGQGSQHGQDEDVERDERTHRVARQRDDRRTPLPHNSSALRHTGAHRDLDELHRPRGRQNFLHGVVGPHGHPAGREDEVGLPGHVLEQRRHGVSVVVEMPTPHDRGTRGRDQGSEHDAVGVDDLAVLQRLSRQHQLVTRGQDRDARLWGDRQFGNVRGSGQRHLARAQDECRHAARHRPPARPHPAGAGADPPRQPRSVQPATLPRRSPPPERSRQHPRATAHRS